MRDEQTEPKDRTPPENRKGRTPDYIVDQRVRRVQFWMQQGHGTAAIYRLAAKSHREELAARKKAKAAKIDADKYPPLVWATDETAVGNRTVDAYIAKAKTLFEIDGRTYSKETATQFGVIMGRLNDLYARALATQNINAAERLLKLQVEIFGISGSIKPTWLEPGAGDDAPATDVPEITQTEEQAERELRGMLDSVLRRMGRNPNDIKWIPGGGTADGPGKGKGGALTKGNGAAGN